MRALRGKVFAIFFEVLFHRAEHGVEYFVLLCGEIARGGLHRRLRPYSDVFAGPPRLPPAPSRTLYT